MSSPRPKPKLSYKAQSYPSSDKPFECTACQLYFRRLHDLKRHERVHSSERPYKCNNCQRAFARLDALKRHLNAESNQRCSTWTYQPGLLNNSRSTSVARLPLQKQLHPRVDGHKSLVAVAYSTHNASDEGGHSGGMPSHASMPPTTSTQEHSFTRPFGSVLYPPPPLNHIPQSDAYPSRTSSFSSSSSSTTSSSHPDNHGWDQDQGASRRHSQTRGSLSLLLHAEARLSNRIRATEPSSPSEHVKPVLKDTQGSTFPQKRHSVPSPGWSQTRTHPEYPTSPSSMILSPSLSPSLSSSPSSKDVSSLSSPGAAWSYSKGLPTSSEYKANSSTSPTTQTRRVRHETWPSNRPMVPLANDLIHHGQPHRPFSSDQANPCTYPTSLASSFSSTSSTSSSSSSSSSASRATLITPNCTTNHLHPHSPRRHRHHPHLHPLSTTFGGEEPCSSHRCEEAMVEIRKLRQELQWVTMQCRTLTENSDKVMQ